MKEATNLMARIASKGVLDAHLSCWWLGGSGFVFKTPAGTVICVDPYLSNCVEELFGMKRAFATPIDPEDLRADAIPMATAASQPQVVNHANSVSWREAITAAPTAVIPMATMPQPGSAVNEPARSMVSRIKRRLSMAWR